MAQTFVRPQDLALAAAGALADNGSQLLTVKVDGTTVQINGSNQLVATAGAGGIATSTLLNTTAPLTGGGLLSTGLTLAIPAATTSADGYLGSTDWNTFNNKVASTRAIQTTTPLTGGGTFAADRTFAILQATTTANGYVSSTDFVTFNNKVASTRAINTTAPLAGGGDLSADRTLSMPVAATAANGYLSSTDWNTFNGKQAAGSYAVTTRNINTTAPLAGGGDLSADRTLSIPVATSTANGYLSSTDFALFKTGSQFVSPSSTITVGTSTGSTTLDRTIPTVFPYTTLVIGAGLVATNAALANRFFISATANFTLSNPTNPVHGQAIVWKITQDGTGGRTMTLDTAFKLGTDLTAVTISSTANLSSYLGAVYSSTTSKWDVLGLMRGF